MLIIKIQMKFEYLRLLEWMVDDAFLKELWERWWELVWISVRAYQSHNILYFKKLIENE